MSLTCPACASEMRETMLEETYGRTVAVDLCPGCQGLWFDGTELLQLSAGGTLSLFRQIADSSATSGPVTGPRCPRCSSRLVEAHDIQRHTRFFFLRCPRDHGRFMTVLQFLRAKNFVRTLTPHEIRELCRHIKQVNCTNCGGAVHLDRSAECPYCRTPVSMLDPDQLTKTVTELEEAAARRTAVDPLLPMRLLEARTAVERAFTEARHERGAQWATLVGQDSPDLVRGGLAALVRLLRGT